MSNFSMMLFPLLYIERELSGRNSLGIGNVNISVWLM